jgi:SNF2 family DNA or RNA helicase
VLDAKSNVIRDWNAGRVPLLFAHPASAGHGLNLAEGGNILAFFSLSWNLEEHMQIIERIGPMRQKQAGLNRPVFLHYLMARNTVDGMILERLNGKKSVQEILLEAMKERKRG